MKTSLGFIILWLSFMSHSMGQKITWEKEFPKNYEYYNNNIPTAIETDDQGFLVSRIIDFKYIYFLKLNKYGDSIERNIIDSGVLWQPLQFVKTGNDAYITLVNYAHPHHSDSYNNECQIIETDSRGRIKHRIHFIRSGTIAGSNNGIDTLSQYTLIPFNEKKYYLLETKYVTLYGKPKYIQSFLSEYAFGTQLIWSKAIGADNVIQNGFSTIDGKLVLFQTNYNLTTNTGHYSIIKTDTTGSILIFQPVNQVDQIVNVSHTYLSGNRLVLLTENANNKRLNLMDDSLRIIKSIVVGDNRGYGQSNIINDGANLYACFAKETFTNGSFELRKYDNDFNLVWNKHFNEGDGCIVPQATGLLRTSDGGMLISGILNNITDVYIKLDRDGNLAIPFKADECGMAYPNPSNEFLFVPHPGFDVPELHIAIYSMLGQLLSDHITSNLSQEDIDIRMLKHGFYLYKLYTQNKIYCQGKFEKF